MIAIIRFDVKLAIMIIVGYVKQLYTSNIWLHCYMAILLTNVANNNVTIKIYSFETKNLFPFFGFYLLYLAKNFNDQPSSLKVAYFTQSLKGCV
jgi:hypothetical protein